VYYGGSSSITATINHPIHAIGTEIAFCSASSGTLNVNISGGGVMNSINSHRRVSSFGMAIAVKITSGLWILAGNLEA